MLIRRHLAVPNISDCVLCVSHQLEDWRHLFFACMFSSRVWNYLQILWQHTGNVAQILKHAKASFQGPCFTEIVILACWAIWKQRNGWIFKNIKPSFRGWKTTFVYEVSLLKYRVRAVDVPILSSWLDNLI